MRSQGLEKQIGLLMAVLRHEGLETWMLAWRMTSAGTQIFQRRWQKSSGLPQMDRCLWLVAAGRAQGWGWWPKSTLAKVRCPVPVSAAAPSVWPEAMQTSGHSQDRSQAQRESPHRAAMRDQACCELRELPPLRFTKPAHSQSKPRTKSRSASLWAAKSRRLDFGYGNSCRVGKNCRAALLMQRP